jgi:AbrB family looped-hinge helix DNA binding protein
MEVSLDEMVGEPIKGFPMGALPGRHMFGLVTVGDKGQIVIPVRARRVFNIKPGDQLMVLGDENSGIALVNAQFFMSVAEGISNGF